MVADVKVIVEFRIVWWRYWLLRAYWYILEILAVFVPEASDFLFYCGIAALDHQKPLQYRQGNDWRPVGVKGWG